MWPMACIAYLQALHCTILTIPAFADGLESGEIEDGADVGHCVTSANHGYAAPDSFWETLVTRSSFLALYIIYSSCCINQCMFPSCVDHDLAFQRCCSIMYALPVCVQQASVEKTYHNRVGTSNGWILPLPIYWGCSSVLCISAFQTLGNLCAAYYLGVCRNFVYEAVHMMVGGEMKVDFKTKESKF